MTDTTFIDQTTVIEASWLNDVNDATYTTLPQVQSDVATNTSDIANKANTVDVVSLTGDQTVAGNKTFSSPIVGSTTTQVSLTGAETIAGVKTFSSPVGVAAAVSSGDALRYDQALGVGQTWQNMTVSRAFGTTYTNSTGKPIQVYAGGSTAIAGACGLSPTVQGVALQGTSQQVVSGNYGVVVSFIVPDGATYVVTATNVASLNWAELR